VLRYPYRYPASLGTIQGASVGKSGSGGTVLTWWCSGNGNPELMIPGLDQGGPCKLSTAFLVWGVSSPRALTHPLLQAVTFQAQDW